MTVFVTIIGCLAFGMITAATVKLNQIAKRLDEIAILLRDRPPER